MLLRFLRINSLVLCREQIYRLNTRLFAAISLILASDLTVCRRVLRPSSIEIHLLYPLSPFLLRASVLYTCMLSHKFNFKLNFMKSTITQVVIAHFLDAEAHD